MAQTALQREFDFVIVGSGFAGSLLAWILARAGRRVLVIDRAVQPRFAIGESSTPLADFLLELIADEFNLPELRPLARWGTWQQSFPELGVGLKRGFSYYQHHSGTPFVDDNEHHSSMLVAASVEDAVGDTHWLRSDVDYWFVRQSQSSGVEFQERCTVEQIHLHKGELRPCELQLSTLGSSDTSSTPITVRCRHVIDSTGGGGVLGRLLDIPRVDGQLRTRTAALFGHFRNVRSMTDWYGEHGLTTVGDPFDGDHAAQHHLLQDGWMWMLRFHSGGASQLTSVGIVRPCARWDPAVTRGQRRNAWQQTVDAYPTLQAMLRGAELVAPSTTDGADTNPALGWVPRISRCYARAAGDYWSMLPGTVGIVDPLHSTGIAHSLSGVRRVARYLLSNSHVDQEQYNRDAVKEVRWIDQLVYAAYLAMPADFELFCAAAKLYLLTAIHSERQIADKGEFDSGFLLSKSEPMVDNLEWLLPAMQHHLADPRSMTRRTLMEELRQRLAPWDDVGLFGSNTQNRFARTSAPK